MGDMFGGSEDSAESESDGAAMFEMSLEEEAVKEESAEEKSEEEPTVEETMFAEPEEEESASVGKEQEAAVEDSMFESDSVEETEEVEEVEETEDSSDMGDMFGGSEDSAGSAAQESTELELTEEVKEDEVANNEEEESSDIEDDIFGGSGGDSGGSGEDSGGSESDMGDMFGEPPESEISTEEKSKEDPSQVAVGESSTPELIDSNSKEVSGTEDEAPPPFEEDMESKELTETPPPFDESAEKEEESTEGLFTQSEENGQKVDEVNTEVQRTPDEIDTVVAKSEEEESGAEPLFKDSFEELGMEPPSVPVASDGKDAEDDMWDSVPSEAVEAASNETIKPISEETNDPGSFEEEMVNGDDSLPPPPPEENKIEQDSVVNPLIPPLSPNKQSKTVPPIPKKKIRTNPPSLPKSSGKIHKLPPLPLISKTKNGKIVSKLYESEDEWVA